MKPLIVLLGFFSSGCLFYYLVDGNPNINGNGRFALTVMLFFTAIGHFKFKKGMAMMLPSFVPAKELIILATGIIEVLLAIAIGISSLQTLAGCLLIAMFILFLPANIYAASRHLDYEKGTYDGKGLSYLWFRIPFQILLIGWIYHFVINPAS